MALREAGREADAEQILGELQDRAGRNSDIRWAIAVYTGDTEEAERLGQSRRGDPRFGIQIAAARAIAP